MEELQGSGINPTPQGDGTPQKSKVEFTEEQQEKVNALIKQERINILTKLGVSSVGEAQQKIESSKDLETFKAKADLYDNVLKEKTELESQNAMLEVGIASDMEEVVKNYFKGANKELTKTNLEKLLEDNPKLKSQWLENTPISKPNVVIGNEQPKSDTPNDGYAEFRKYTRY